MVKICIDSVRDLALATACRKDAADIQQGDEFIYNILTEAVVNSRSVTIEVDDSLPTVHGVCKITAVWAMFGFSVETND